MRSTGFRRIRLNTSYLAQNSRCILSYRPQMPTPLSLESIAELRRQYPQLRDDYFDYLSAVGWGETEAGPNIYSGPIDPDEIYGARDEHVGIVLLGNDFQGYCFGYNTETQCYGEISDDGHWEPWANDRGIRHYIADPNENTK